MPPERSWSAACALGLSREAQEWPTAAGRPPHRTDRRRHRVARRAGKGRLRSRNSKCEGDVALNAPTKTRSTTLAFEALIRRETCQRYGRLARVERRVRTHLPPHAS